MRRTCSDALLLSFMLLSALLTQLPHLSAHGPTDRSVHTVHHDSRQIGPNDIFVAIQGAAVDGRKFAPNLNAAAVISDGPVQVKGGVCVIHVDNARLALAQCAAILSNHPAQNLPVIGITGTNGKTTTAWLIEQLLMHHRIKTGIIGTLSHRVNGDLVQQSTHTTPEASTLQPMLRSMLEGGCHCAIMEVSSIGLDMHRVDAIPFKMGVFTNLSRDHLDYHSDYDAYFEAKRRLFTDLIAPDGTVILNADDPRYQDLANAHPSTISYGLHAHADYWFEIQGARPTGFELILHTPTLDIPCNLPLIGQHNLYNLLAALIVVERLGCPISASVEFLPDLKSAPGRLESVLENAPFQVFTDYAHTPDALRHVLQSLNKQCSGRLIIVFGCGGDRDKGKRQEMGRIAESLSSIAIVTSDNPRSEPPERIIQDICKAMTHPICITDRRAAIQYALECAQPDDVILIAGKGHENYQEINGQRFPFEDRAAVKKLYEAFKNDS